MFAGIVLCLARVHELLLVRSTQSSHGGGDLESEPLGMRPVLKACSQHSTNRLMRIVENMFSGLVLNNQQVKAHVENILFGATLL